MVNWSLLCDYFDGCRVFFFRRDSGQRLPIRHARCQKNQYLAKHENDESRKMLMLTRSRKELNYPYLPVELDTDYTSYIKRGNAALICERKQT